MAKPYSMDLRERVVRAVTAEGMSCHAAAARFGVAPSSAIKWMRRYRDTGTRGHRERHHARYGRETVRISVCERAVEHYAAMALMKRSPKMTANCALAMDHSRGGILHSFSERFKIR